MRKTILIISFASLFLSLALIGIGESVDLNFMTSNILSAAGSFLLLLFLTTLFLFFYITSKKKIFKILSMIVFLFFGLTTILGIGEIYDVYQDRSAYANEEFERIVGVPEKVTSETGRHIEDPYITSVTMEGMTIDTMQLLIKEEAFKEKYQAKEIEVLYLPNSHIAVEINVAGDGE